MTISKKEVQTSGRVGIREYYNSRWKLNKKTLLECDYCKKAFVRPRSNVKGTTHYCSRDCHKAAQRLPKPEQEQA